MQLDPELEPAIDRLYIEFARTLPSLEDLRLIARRYSNDFAALFLADRLWQDQRNRTVRQTFHKHMAQSRDQLFRPPEQVADYRVLLVPGWNYRSNGHHHRIRQYHAGGNPQRSLFR